MICTNFQLFFALFVLIRKRPFKVNVQNVQVLLKTVLQNYVANVKTYFYVKGAFLRNGRDRVKRMKCFCYKHCNKNTSKQIFNKFLIILFSKCSCIFLKFPKFSWNFIILGGNLKFVITEMISEIYLVILLFWCL